MIKRNKKFISMLLILSLTLSILYPGINTQAVKKPNFQNTKITLQVGKKITLKIKNNISGAKKTFTTSNKKVATVSSKGIVKAISKGNTVISCKIKKGKKAYKIKSKITVVKKQSTPRPSSTPTSNGDQTITTPTPTPTSTPVSTEEPEPTYGPTMAPTQVAEAGSIRAAAGDKFTFGVALNSWQLENSSQLAFTKKEYNSITMENEMKPENMMDQTASQNDSKGEPCINKTLLSKILTSARDNGLKVRGHCLVWYSQTPDWFFRTGYKSNGTYVTKDVLESRMEIYIKKMIQYCQYSYPGVVYAWDVVNEAVDGSNYRTGSKWYTIYKSADYIEKAFTFARKYATKGQKLFYNDYGEYDPGKRDFIYTMCKSLKEKGVLDGIGMQSHWDFSPTQYSGGMYPTTDVLKAALDKYASIPGIEIQLTEVDLHCSSNASTTQANLATQYYNLFKTVMEAKNNGANITNITFWGLTDANSWLIGFKGSTSYPLLFDASYNRKKSYYGVLAAINGDTTFTP